MSYETILIHAGLAEKSRKNRWPARLDLLQSGTGLFLALFMWLHMFFVASILLGKDVFWTVARFFEGYFIFGKAYPGLVSCVVGFVLLALALHALMAVRKFPISYRQWRAIRAHAKMMRHADSTLWIWQVYTGFLMFFLASAHLYQMFFWPQDIDPYLSSDRMWSAGLWPFYLALLLAVELHGGIGLYRLAVKWGWPNASREALKKVKWALTGFFLVLGLLTLAAYIKIGYEHRAADAVGGRYTPAWALEKEGHTHRGDGQ
ncbi:MAG: fumarate reductase cytochrome b subunit [Azoarcus sp.]|jgi:fumarate reductase subunit C|nr:fumarate reductase cytochrome b subunit [Azoarcus sp.]